MQPNLPFFASEGKLRLRAFKWPTRLCIKLPQELEIKSKSL